MSGIPHFAGPLCNAEPAIAFPLDPDGYRVAAAPAHAYTSCVTKWAGPERAWRKALKSTDGKFLRRTRHS